VRFERAKFSPAPWGRWGERGRPWAMGRGNRFFEPRASVSGRKLGDRQNRRAMLRAMRREFGFEDDEIRGLKGKMG